MFHPTICSVESLTQIVGIKGGVVTSQIFDSILPIDRAYFLAV
jgi:hypothetical protein